MFQCHRKLYLFSRLHSKEDRLIFSVKGSIVFLRHDDDAAEEDNDKVVMTTVTYFT